MHQNAPQNKNLQTPGPVPRLLYTRGCAPDPLKVVGPESPPGARVTQNSRYTTDGLEMVMASSSRIAIASLQVWLSLHLILADEGSDKSSEILTELPRFTLLRANTVYNIYVLA